MYIVIRRWANAAGLAEVVGQHEQEIGDLLRGVRGFVTYYAARHGDEVTAVTVCQDREGTEETTRIAREWVQRHLPGTTVGAPEVIEGEIILQV
jgi:hypothetical protein